MAPNTFIHFAAIAKESSKFRYFERGKKLTKESKEKRVKKEKLNKERAKKNEWKKELLWYYQNIHAHYMYI